MSLPNIEDAHSLSYCTSNADTVETSNKCSVKSNRPTCVTTKQEYDSYDESALKKRRLSMQVVAVLSFLSSRNISLTDVTIATIRDKRNAAKIAATLGALPSEFSHLKRIRKNNGGSLQVILGTSSEGSSTLVAGNNSLTNDIREAIDVDSVTRVKVPAIAPVTKAQLAEAAEYWPCNFHPDKEIEKLLSTNAGFTVDELQSIRSNMEYVLKASDEADKIPACLIFNPVSRVVVTCQVGYKLDEHPLKHSVVAALDALSEVQGGSKFKETNFVKLAISSNDVKSTEYLCTGFDVFLTIEPCIMCAMALLHSRARRVFFIEHSPKVGALSSLIQLQFLKGINHRFQVFKVNFG